MAKDLTQMPIEKLWARARAALEEIERRTSHIAPPIRVARDTYAHPAFMTPAQEEAAQQATIARRLATSKRIPRADPLMQQLWEQTMPRPAPRHEVTLADGNGTPVGEAE